MRDYRTLLLLTYCTSKRIFNHAQTQAPNSSPHSSVDGGPVRDRQYGYSTPGTKRQQYDSNYHPHSLLFNPSQSSERAMFQYGAILQRSGPASSVQQYSLRTPQGPWPTLLGLQTHTSLPDTGIEVKEHRSLLHTSSDLPDHTGNVNVGQFPARGVQHHQDLTSSHGQHGVFPGPTKPDDQSYHRIPRTVANTTTFDTPFETSAIPYDQDQYTGVLGFFQEPRRDTYPSNIGVFSDGSLSLDTGALNGGSTPPYAEQQEASYSASTGQESADCAKSQLDPYPAPHHTRPYS